MCTDCREFRGRRYHLDGRSPYYRCRGKLLHREMWIAANGPIPDGYEVHHRDEDASHNGLANFELLTPEQHNERHPFKPWDGMLEHLDRVRPMTAAWHGSEAGLAWHREHAHESILARPVRKHTCEQCGSGFETTGNGRERFCSNSCKTQWRRLSGLDDVEKVCHGCGGTFTANRYATAKCCSRKCSLDLRYPQRLIVK